MMTRNLKKTEKNFRQTLRLLAQPTNEFPIAFENELHRLIQEAAYELAEEDGFKESPEHYWFMAKEKVYRTH